MKIGWVLSNWKQHVKICHIRHTQSYLYHVPEFPTRLFLGHHFLTSIFSVIDELNSIKMSQSSIMIYYQQICKISKRLDKNWASIVKFKTLCQKCTIKEHSLIPVYAQCGLHLPPPLNDTVFSTCCFEFDHTRPICNQSLSYVADLLIIP